jgi:cell division protein FtsL
MNQVDATDARLQTHEEICALRYEAIQKSFEQGRKRMTRIEYILYALIAVTLLGPGFAAEMLKKMLGV